MSPAEAEELRRLVEQAQIVPTSGTVPMPDQREVTVSVETGDQRLEVTFAEGEAPPGMDQLLDYLDRRAGVIPND